MAGITIRERRDGKVVRMQATIYAVPPDSLKAERYRITVPVSVTSKSGAMRWAEAVRRDIEAGKPLPQSREPKAPCAAKSESTASQVVTFRTAVDTYLADLAGRGAAASTVRAQRNHLVRVLGDADDPDTIGALPLTDVGEAEASRVRAAMRAHGYAVGTINECMRVLTTMLRRCHVLRLRGVVDKIERVSGRKVKISKAYDDATFDALVAASTDPTTLVILRLVGDAALRVGELLGLDVGDVDTARQTLRVERAVTPSGEIGPTKNGEARIVPLTRQLVEALAPLVEGRPATDPLLPGGSPIGRVGRGFIRKRLVAAQTAVGLPAKGAHVLRHTCATSALRNGADPVAVQKLLGHASLKTTIDMYIHDTGDAAVRAVSALESRHAASARGGTDMTRAPMTTRQAPKRNRKNK